MNLVDYISVSMVSHVVQCFCGKVSFTEELENFCIGRVVCRGRRWEVCVVILLFNF